MATYGAYVTVRFWCPDLYDEPDEDVIRFLLEEDSVEGLEESREIVSIEIVKQEGKQ